MKESMAAIRDFSRHSVIFYSPGTLFAESTTLDCPSEDTRWAARQASKITERHGAKPYGFVFETSVVKQVQVDGGWKDVSSKTTRRSGMHYLTGKILSYDDILKKAEQDESRWGIAASNMRGNDMAFCLENKNSFLSLGQFGPTDVLLDARGNVMKRGDDPSLVEYRKRFVIRMKKEREEWIKEHSKSNR